MKKVLSAIKNFFVKLGSYCKEFFKKCKSDKLVLTSAIVSGVTVLASIAALIVSSICMAKVPEKDQRHANIMKYNDMTAVALNHLVEDTQADAVSEFTFKTQGGYTYREYDLLEYKDDAGNNVSKRSITFESATTLSSTVAVKKVNNLPAIHLLTTENEVEKSKEVKEDKIVDSQTSSVTTSELLITSYVSEGTLTYYCAGTTTELITDEEGQTSTDYEYKQKIEIESEEQYLKIAQNALNDICSAYNDVGVLGFDLFENLYCDPDFTYDYDKKSGEDHFEMKAFNVDASAYFVDDLGDDSINYELAVTFKNEKYSYLKTTIKNAKKDVNLDATFDYSCSDTMDQIQDISEYTVKTNYSNLNSGIRMITAPTFDIDL